MDSGYFDEEIIKTIESLGCKYLIKAKAYSTLASQVVDLSIPFVKGTVGRETTEWFTKLDKWEKKRKFVVSRVLKPEKERVQLSLLEGSEYRQQIITFRLKYVFLTIFPTETAALPSPLTGGALNVRI